MSKKCLDFLFGSFLYSPSACASEYGSFSEKEIYDALQEYREYVISNMEEIQHEIRGDKNKLNVVLESCKALPTEDVYKQLVLYMDQVVIADPLFNMTESRAPFSDAAGQLLGLSPPSQTNKKELCEAISYIQNIEELITSGFVVMLPLSLMHEGPKNIPITFSPTAYSDVIPKSILEYFRSIAVVRNLIPSEKGLQVVTDKPLELGTRILVEFHDDDLLTGSLYQYINSKVIDYDEETGKATFAFRLADSISLDAFQTWINQSINQAANGHFKKIYNELVLSQRCGCMYLTKSNIVSKALNMVIDRPSKESELASMALSFELPITSQITIKDLLSIRKDYGEAFHNFRTELNSKLLGLDVCADSETLRRQIESISYEMNSVQVQEVEKEYRKIARTLKLDALAMSGSLVASFTTGGLTTIGAVTAFIKGISDVSKYYTEVHENNGFFLWKINKLAEKYQV
jgi:hypothetical protein